MNVFIMIILPLLLIETASSNGILATDHSQFLEIQKELPDANIYRQAGDWVIRATSDRDMTFSRIQIALNNDKVFENYYNGNHLIYSENIKHMPDNKMLQSEENEGMISRRICLYQDKSILINMLIKNNTKTLLVLVRASMIPYIGDNHIETAIKKHILNKSNIRILIESPLKQLVFINHNSEPVNYELESSTLSFNIAESDLVEVDMCKSVGKWKMVAVSGGTYAQLTDGHAHLNGDQLIINFNSNEEGKKYSITFKYIENSRIIRVDIYGHDFYDHVRVAFLYVDDTQFIMVARSAKDHEMAVFCRDKRTCDMDYLKGVIDNVLLFNQDVKRDIKQLVPKLKWKTN